jgi:hypothetical protein
LRTAKISTDDPDERGVKYVERPLAHVPVEAVR